MGDGTQGADDVRIIQVSRTIDAPAGRVFAYLADPDHHAGLDASGMVRGSADHHTVTGLGAVFVMDMHNEMMGDYRVENHVVVYELDHALGWAPAAPGQPPAGHTFVWRLEPAGQERTIVSQTYDWSAFTHLEFLDHLPVVNRDELNASLDRLAHALAGDAVEPPPAGSRPERTSPLSGRVGGFAPRAGGQAGMASWVASRRRCNCWRLP